MGLTVYNLLQRKVNTSIKKLFSIAENTWARLYIFKGSNPFLLITRIIAENVIGSPAEQTTASPELSCST
jgi:hypothetical protein